MEPTVGRIVIYVAYGTPGGEYTPGAGRAAVVTEVHGNFQVGLAILNPSGLFFARNVAYDPDGSPGSWHWPDRV
jgi:hypothetical protein